MATQRRNVSRIQVLLVLAVVFLWPSSLRAQPVPGDRVRVTAGQGRIPFEAVGTLVRFSADSLALETATHTMTLGRTAIRTLEVSRGRETNAGKGALIGGVGTGLTLGVALSMSVVRCNQAEPFGCIGPDPFTAFGLGTLLGGMVGSCAGAIVGLLVRSDRWEEVPLDGFTVTLVPPTDQSAPVAKMGFRIQF